MFGQTGVSQLVVDSDLDIPVITYHFKLTIIGQLPGRFGRLPCIELLQKNRQRPRKTYLTNRQLPLEWKLFSCRRNCAD